MTTAEQSEQSQQVPSGTVVVGVDGSPGAAAALDWAVAEARRAGRALTLAHGWHEGALVVVDVAGYDHTVLRSELAEESRRLVERTAEEVRASAPDLEVHTISRSHDPRSLLLALAERAAVVVVGSRGRGPVASLLLGSVGAAVARHARCPVAVVRGASGAQPGGVLVAADGTDVSVPAVELAYEHAASRGVPLTVLHACWDARAVARGVDVDQLPGAEDLRVSLSQTLAGLAEKYPDVRVVVDLESGLTERVVDEAARGRELVVVGHHRSGLVGSLLHGSVAVHVVEHAEVPVLVVPAD